MQKTIYEHYFRGIESDFSKELVKPIKNRRFTKPEGGFWASATNAKYGWKRWCTDECEPWAEEIPFKFTLKDEANILYIRDVADIPDDLIADAEKPIIDLTKPACLFSSIYLDFEEMSKRYDGIEIDAGSNAKLYYLFYGWDCDSICIFNPDIIMEVEE